MINTGPTSNKGLYLPSWAITSIISLVVSLIVCLTVLAEEKAKIEVTMINQTEMLREQKIEIQRLQDNKVDKAQQASDFKVIMDFLKRIDIKLDEHISSRR
jgi:hypothetical protein